ncbi:hypothetical protein K440DRAFT_51776 [Wilcoxina mikolae CBS 423.85]|nr:hypothetical protein K440DRAFT_51776 [Wilcoxina mikolae CBS 423.85]
MMYLCTQVESACMCLSMGILLRMWVCAPGVRGGGESFGVLVEGVEGERRWRRIREASGFHRGNRCDWARWLVGCLLR